MAIQDTFMEVYRNNIHREGADALLDYLCRSDFFTAPASAKFHSAYAGGLAEHSLNVYHCLVDFLNRDRVKEVYKIQVSPESAAIVALLHDVCKSATRS